MSAPAIRATGLVRTFGRARAVDGVELSVPVGGVYGLLGPNGAGKTTTIRILATLLRPDAGTAEVFGHDVVSGARAVRARIGLTGQFSSVDDDLTGTENLMVLARLLGHRRRAARCRVAELLDALGLGAAAGRPVRTYSGGMRRRVDIAASVLAAPDLLFLDEPTTGLDPHSRGHVWEVVRALVERGTTVLLTTQYLDEADRLADRVAVVDRGRVSAEGTPGELKASTGAGVLRVRLADRAAAGRAARVLGASLGVRVAADADAAELSARLGGAPPAALAARALADLSAAGIEVGGFELGRPSLDEVFLALTGPPRDTAEAAACPVPTRRPQDTVEAAR